MAEVSGAVSAPPKCRVSLKVGSPINFLANVQSILFKKARDSSRVQLSIEVNLLSHSF